MWKSQPAAPVWAQDVECCTISSTHVLTNNLCTSLVSMVQVQKGCGECSPLLQSLMGFTKYGPQTTGETHPCSQSIHLPPASNTNPRGQHAESGPQPLQNPEPAGNQSWWWSCDVTTQNPSAESGQHNKFWANHRAAQKSTTYHSWVCVCVCEHAVYPPSYMAIFTRGFPHFFKPNSWSRTSHSGEPAFPTRQFPSAQGSVWVQNFFSWPHNSWLNSVDSLRRLILIWWMITVFIIFMYKRYTCSYSYSMLYLWL